MTNARYKTKAHQKYKLADGSVVKGVTTIIKENLGWNKQALIAWARREAMAGNDPNLIRDEAASIGTITHYLIECHLKNRIWEMDLSIYPKSDIDVAETCFLAYLEWERVHDLKTLQADGTPLVSEKYRYGGTLDWIGYIDGKLAIMDYKTGTGVYDEARIQAAAYKQLWIENNGGQGDPMFWLLHLGKKDGEFAPYQWADLSRWWSVFEHLLAIDQLRER